MKTFADKLIADRADDRRSQGRAGISPTAVFRDFLRHERCRSDRDGSEFSLAVFDLSGMNSGGVRIKQAANCIREKKRAIDEVGWIDSQSIGVLLPVTSIEGGRVFAHRVGNSIPCTVYAYPAHWPVGQNDRGGRDDRIGAARPGKCEDAIGQTFCRATPFWKSCIDVAGSLTFIVLLSPLFLLMAVYIRMVSPGRIFFRQKRVGHGGRLFEFMKFRTMHEGNDPCAHREYLKELIRSGRPMEKLDRNRDPRIIPGGRILRRTCLDELPQLFNVLRGDMSLVGPRPCIPYEAEEFLRWHAHRFDILPGMTGLWQVSGKNSLSFAEMIRLDISYANRMSPLLDLKILLSTGPAIIRMVLEAGARRMGINPCRTTAAVMIDKGGVSP